MRYIRLSTVLLLAACGDGEPTAPPTPPTPVATSITLSATSLSFDSIFQTQQLSTTVKDQNGATMTGVSVTWSSSLASVATVSPAGQVTAVGNGSAEVTATSGSASATAAVTVTDTYLVVTVKGDGDPLPNVSVWLTDPTETDTKKITASAGKVVFPSLMLGEHTVTLQQVPSGLRVTSPQTIQINQNQAHDLVFEGAFAPAQVTGTAKAFSTPAKGALVTFQGKDTVEVTVDTSGVFQVDSVNHGHYTITIRNYTGLKFKEDTLTQTLDPGANTVEFVGRPEWSEISPAAHHTCGVTKSGDAYCWGWSAYGMLGNGHTGFRSLPSLVNGGLTWKSVKAGYTHTCGVTDSDNAYCWGQGGALGELDVADRSVPVPVSGGHTWTTVAAGHRTSCGVTTSGDAYCWGGGNYGELGDGQPAHNHSSRTPSLVAGGHSWASVHTTIYYSCGVTTSGDAYCWGRNEYGQLGDGTNSDINYPVLVSGGHTWASVKTGMTGTCGLTTTGDAYCWGRLPFGGGTITAPALVSGGHTWVSIETSSSHTCGVTAFNEAYCWGMNDRGQLGDGSTTNRAELTKVATELKWGSVVTNGYATSHTCGITTLEDAYCWGGNHNRTIGDGTTIERHLPVEVGGNW